MDSGQTQIFDEIIRDVEAAYKKYLEVEGVEDNIVHRIAFYATFETVVHHDPIADNDLQIAVSRRLSSIKYEAIEELMDDVEEIHSGVARHKVGNGKKK